MVRPNRRARAPQGRGRRGEGEGGGGRGGEGGEGDEKVEMPDVSGLGGKCLAAAGRALDKNDVGISTA